MESVWQKRDRYDCSSLLLNLTNIQVSFLSMCRPTEWACQNPEIQALKVSKVLILLNGFNAAMQSSILMLGEHLCQKGTRGMSFRYASEWRKTDVIDGLGRQRLKTATIQSNTSPVLAGAMAKWLRWEIRGWELRSGLSQPKDLPISHASYPWKATATAIERRWRAAEYRLRRFGSGSGTCYSAIQKRRMSPLC